ncbi:hypothetical protein HPB50_010700 [Hyalomma asiaticum]|uniref:Uncharacterized protein n=1 Tax=Hyalomma asiaticum TaxID=266040 RepID=A0ACB7SJU5_HYAAI|nr:hypothetical protein HPB50_010700 [Hyalomma asiaticum]
MMAATVAPLKRERVNFRGAVTDARTRTHRERVPTRVVEDAGWRGLRRRQVAAVAPLFGGRSNHSTTGETERGRTHCGRAIAGKVQWKRGSCDCDRGSLAVVLDTLVWLPQKKHVR